MEKELNSETSDQCFDYGTHRTPSLLHQWLPNFIFTHSWYSGSWNSTYCKWKYAAHNQKTDQNQPDLNQSASNITKEEISLRTIQDPDV